MSGTVRVNIGSGANKFYVLIGMITAIVCSYSVSHSIGWAIAHMFLSWLYVIYWIFMYGLEMFFG